MKYIFHCLYLKGNNHQDIWQSCQFLDENGYPCYENKIYEYIAISISGDFYQSNAINNCFEIINQAEKNADELYSFGGQDFSLDISAEKVIFYHNEFDEEDGWPDLSCSLSMFKTALLAWNAFLQLPKSIHTELKTVID